jgi:hypothetical protein
MNAPKHNVLLEAENIAAGKIIHNINRKNMTIKDFKEAKQLAEFMIELEGDKINFNLF